MSPAADDATRAQITAADPGASSWVSANAGSGKTRVLTDRVARLLLRGTEPTSILCLTYTKAAAAEMQNRLFKRLGTWSMLEDATLRSELSLLGETGQAVEAAQLARARTLFARALETPGGLKIQTIHSFCEQLLRRFPIEAGIAPDFEVLDDRDAARIRADLIEVLADDADSGFSELAPHILSRDQSLDELMLGILSEREGFAGPLDPGAIAAALGGGGAPVDGSRSILSALSEVELNEVFSAVDEAGGKTAKKAIAALHDMQARGDQVLDPLFRAFLVSTRNWAVRDLSTKALVAAHPGIAEQLDKIGSAVAATREAVIKRGAFLQSMALGRFARAFLAAYDTRKAELGKLDFDDLIERARALLKEREAALWITYKLDGGIDHVLVDEAQDTSPAQWQVIDALTDDFFSGQSARDTRRTVFVVGDRKQSIYSFQGADPAEFDHRSGRYRQALEDVRQTLEFCELAFSFRSAAPILNLVDAVFGDQAGQPLGPGIGHRTFRTDLPGRVEIWPFEATAEKPDPLPWHNPVDQPPPDAPPQRLARRIADRIGDLLGKGAGLPGADRPIRPGDFLILVRRRGALFRAIIAELKSRGLPVAGADRLQVGAQLAVRDLMALLRFLTTPEDDLSLAAVLRSPLIGVTEAELFEIARGRQGTLFAALLDRKRDGDAARMLADLRARVDFLRPYELFQRVLIQHGARARIRARLGGEADDAVSALLDLALAYEQIEAPTTTGFIGWMDSADPEMKRQLDPAAGEIRVMTVHGAKGLEAPIVILPDTMQIRRRGTGAPLTRMAPGMVALRPRKDMQPDRISAAEDVKAAREAEESWRLLYVALTRAESWLMIGGGGDETAVDGSWYGAISDAARRIGARQLSEGGQLIQSDTWHTDSVSDEPSDPAQRAPLAAPWLSSLAPTPPARPGPLIPSDLSDEALAHPGGEGLGREAALKRGTDLHLLLERLPAHPPKDRDQVAQALLFSGSDPTGADTVAALTAEARAVIETPGLAWIFAGNSLPEVPIAGRIAALGERTLSGQIDRLVVGTSDVTAVDFKSDPQIPETPGNVALAYRLQLAAYAAALSEVFPNRRVRTGIVWTRRAQWMELDHEDVTTLLQTAARH